MEVVLRWVDRPIFSLVPSMTHISLHGRSHVVARTLVSYICLTHAHVCCSKQVRKVTGKGSKRESNDKKSGSGSEAQVR